MTTEQQNFIAANKNTRRKVSARFKKGGRLRSPEQFGYNILRLDTRNYRGSKEQYLRLHNSISYIILANQQFFLGKANVASVPIPL